MDPREKVVEAARVVLANYDAGVTFDPQARHDALEALRAALAAHDAAQAKAGEVVVAARVTRDIPAWSGGDAIPAGTILPVVRWPRSTIEVMCRGKAVALHASEWEPYATPPRAALEAVAREAWRLGDDPSTFALTLDEIIARAVAKGAP